MSKKDKPKPKHVTRHDKIRGEQVSVRVEDDHKPADEAMLDAMLGKPRTDDPKTDEKK